MLKIDEKKLIKLLHDFPKIIKELEKTVGKLKKLEKKIDLIREELLLSIEQNEHNKSS